MKGPIALCVALSVTQRARSNSDHSGIFPEVQPMHPSQHVAFSANTEQTNIMYYIVWNPAFNEPSEPSASSVRRTKSGKQQQKVFCGVPVQFVSWRNLYSRQNSHCRLLRKVSLPRRLMDGLIPPLLASVSLSRLHCQSVSQSITPETSLHSMDG